jgi:hypothetical protein
MPIHNFDVSTNNWTQTWWLCYGRISVTIPRANGQNRLQILITNFQVETVITEHRSPVNVNSSSEVAFIKAKETHMACCRKTSHTRTHTRTHTHTRARARARARTHTHTHFNTANISLPKNAFPLHLSFDAVVIVFNVCEEVTAQAQPTLNLQIR